MASIKKSSMEKMINQYPKVLQRNFFGQIAYTLRGESPEELFKTGGIYPREEKIWLSHTGSGDNTGSVCFSLLPEVTSLFFKGVSAKSKNNEAYLYAFPLRGAFLLPGGRWRQIISPGVFPLPDAWRARKMLGLLPSSQSPLKSCIQLGPLLGSGEFELPSSCQRFLDYLNVVEDRLIQPQELTYSDDLPQEFDIIDTELTEQFQKEVEEYYQNMQYTLKLRR